MRSSPLLTLLATLAASTAFAQDDAPSLDGVGRISIQGGWRYVSNSTLYNSYYSQPGNAGLERAAKSPGGPLLVGSFAYAMSDLVEVGIDLFGTGERLQLTDQPQLTTLCYGALLGVRLQKWVALGPEGTVPFVGVLTGPLLATATFKGERPQETLTQAYAATVGATARLNPHWGLSLEFRQVFARGTVSKTGQRFSSFNAGGSWLSVGVSYAFPPDPGPSLRNPF
ncbi:hypothetical protein [Hyalangium sp.]|uniref:hypothetical protein n=1 Tax=Hyalangium sp. TaxID=2028555 RepID=UPI002D3B7FD1|nr:hypothetical protein [Hyalangium sp.]HYI01073.1 hypothetical protein [Hyalangium sp.]